MLMFGWDFKLMLSQDSEDEIRLRFAFELAKWLWQDELNPRVRCAFGNVLFQVEFSVTLICRKKQNVKKYHLHLDAGLKQNVLSRCHTGRCFGWKMQKNYLNFWSRQMWNRKHRKKAREGKESNLGEKPKIWWLFKR